MKYKVVGMNPAYDTQPGGTVELDPSDPLVQLNVEGGVIMADGPAPTMSCPGCIADGRKRPQKLGSQQEVNEHYAEKHLGLVAPEWKEEVN